VTLLQSQVDSFCNPDDDGFLPHHLWLNGIATMINKNATACIRDFATPPIHHVDGMDTNRNLFDKVEQQFCHVQGYTPRALRVGQGRDRFEQGRGCNRGLNRARRDMDHRGFTGLRDRGNTDLHPGDRGLSGTRNRILSGAAQG
jgi:hypothetical protein